MAKKKMTIDDLAIMVKREFDHANETMADKASVKQGFVEANQKLDHMSARLGSVERDVAEIRKHFVYRDEFEDALSRIRLLEKKLGIQSGK